MFKKTVLLINLIIIASSGVQAQDPAQQPESGQQEVSHHAFDEDDEPVFCDFDQPEISPQLVQSQKPSAVLKFLAKGYPIFAWCMSMKKSMMARFVAIKNSLKNWFDLQQRDAQQ